MLSNNRRKCSICDYRLDPFTGFCHECDNALNGDPHNHEEAAFLQQWEEYVAHAELDQERYWDMK